MWRPARRRSALRKRSRREIRPVRGLRPARRAEGARRADPARDPRKLLLRPGLPTCLRQCDRAADRRREMAGHIPDGNHHRLCLSLGGYSAQSLTALDEGESRTFAEETNMATTALTRRTLLSS